MRLTLRTLLAWLDDTLSPSEVREIGRQVSDSPFAKDLVERIHKVARQRRLSVPPRTGPEAVDANVVASYLDNELDPDSVAALEKKCLTSDVHLAEVASVHQVLSLIGQKAKVPAEARRRMYHLIKGRESVHGQAPRASKQTEPETVSEPVQPWVTPPPPPRPWFERFGPVGAVLALILVLCWSAWKTLTPPEPSPNFVPKAAINATGERAGAAAVALPVAAGPALAARPDEPKATEPKVDSEEPDDKTAATVAKADAKKQAPAPAFDVPPGAVGLAKKPVGVLLRYNPERRDWDRLSEATGLHEQDRLLGLEPFRSSIELGTALVDLVGETEVWARATPPSEAARFTLTRGRVVLHGTTPSLPFEVQFAGKTVTITSPSGGLIGLQRLNRRAPGVPTPLPPVLRVFASDGPVTISAAGHEETLDAAGAVSVEPTGAFTDKVNKAPPAWVTETEPPSFDQTVGKQFQKFFRNDRPIVSTLVEASEDDEKDVARKAIEALRAVGDVSYIVPLLNKRGDATAAASRRQAIGVLRDYLSQDADSAKALHEQLQRDLGNDLGGAVEKLLVGYTPKEAAQSTIYAGLVQVLGGTEESAVGLRELALDNLMTLTGRDDLEYDPEKSKPDSKGLRAWRDLLRTGELRAVGSTPKTK